jgi:hypothetical protein
MGGIMILTAKTDLIIGYSEYTKDGESLNFADWIWYKRAGYKLYQIGIETRQAVKKSTIKTIYVYKE